MQDREWIRKAFAIIDQTRGAIFGATFRKADGSIRHGTFRTHYKWERTTDSPKRGRTYMREAHGNILVVDMDVARKRGQRAAIRSIKAERLLSIRYRGAEFKAPA